MNADNFNGILLIFSSGLVHCREIPRGFFFKNLSIHPWRDVTGRSQTACAVSAFVRVRPRRPRLQLQL
jgi:hypothetical protein